MCDFSCAPWRLDLRWLPCSHDPTTNTRATDPESDALQLIIDAVETATGSTAFREPMTDLGGARVVEWAFAGLIWGDALAHGCGDRHDAVMVDDADGALRRRGAAVRSAAQAGGNGFGVGPLIAPRSARPRCRMLARCRQAFCRVLPTLDPRALRHRFATRVCRGSRNLRAVQALLGHSSVTATERYTQLTPTRCAPRCSPPQ
jgi:hypothetical protein